MTSISIEETCKGIVRRVEKVNTGKVMLTLDTRSIFERMRQKHKEPLRITFPQIMIAITPNGLKLPRISLYEAKDDISGRRVQYEIYDDESLGHEIQRLVIRSGPYRGEYMAHQEEQKS